MYLDHEYIPPASVADHIDFAKLPEETQRLAQRVIKNSVYSVSAFNHDEDDEL